MSTGGDPEVFSVRRGKITEYLLDVHHPVGGSKAKFFLGLGFSPGDAAGMGDALMAHAVANGPGRKTTNPQGLPILVIEGPIVTPDGRNPRIRTVWLVQSESRAEFVTAYPCR